MRSSTIQRTTAETSISVELNIDGEGKAQISTGIGFLDHMLEQIARHGLMDLKVVAKGDLHVDAHHTTEDVGIALGQAFRAALGEKRGIARYAHAYVPLDEALTRVVVDISNRPWLVWKVDFPAEKVGTFDTELFHEFFYAFAVNAGITLHVENLHGRNAHHIAETCFKGLARALRAAAARDPRLGDVVPSTKGSL